MATVKFKPGDRVTLDYDRMTPGNAAHWRERVGDAVGVVAHTNPSRNTVQVGWDYTLGWFDADALVAETVQPGLWA